MTEPLYIEINLHNYDEDDVDNLNQWGIWAQGGIGTTPETRRRFIPRRLDGSQKRIPEKEAGVCPKPYRGLGAK